MCRHTLEHIHDTKNFVETIREGHRKPAGHDRLLRDPRGEHRPRKPRLLGHLLRTLLVLQPRITGPALPLVRLRSSRRVHRLRRSVSAHRGEARRIDFGDTSSVGGVRRGNAPPCRSFPVGSRAAEGAAGNARCKASTPGGRSPVIWGSGSKCVAFLTTLGIDSEIECVVDINPRRHGKYIAGVGKRIVPPEHLKEFKPETIIVMNPIYKDEIARTAQ